MDIIRPILALTVVAACVGVGAYVLNASEGDDTLIGADGQPIADPSGFEPVPGFETAAPHELVRYEMPEPSEVPDVPADTRLLTFEELWEAGEYVDPHAINAVRIGTPTANEFPEGTSEEDIANFFLDLGDMRSLQPLLGTLREELDGERVRIAGYTTPVGFAENETRFLLVPVLGACIHVPPPPPNQIVYVDEPDTTPQMFAPVWVTGTLRADPVATILADVGYRMEDVTVTAYR